MTTHPPQGWTRRPGAVLLYWIVSSRQGRLGGIGYSAASWALGGAGCCHRRVAGGPGRESDAGNPPAPLPSASRCPDPASGFEGAGPIDGAPGRRRGSRTRDGAAGGLYADGARVRRCQRSRSGLDLLRREDFGSAAGRPCDRSEGGGAPASGGRRARSTVPGSRNPASAPRRNPDGPKAPTGPTSSTVAVPS